MADYRNIRLEDRGFMTWVVLNRPEASNALSQDLLDELSDALNSLRHEGPKVIGIRGEGPGFCAGYDLNGIGLETAGDDPVGDRERLQGYLDVYGRMWDHPKPIIAAIHGFCIGGGTQIGTYADITIVAEDAHIGQAKVPVGGGFVTPLWAQFIGPKRAKEMAFTAGAGMDGRTAAEWGWANRAVPSDTVIEEAEKLAEQFSRLPSDLLRIKKLAINRSMDSTGPRGALDVIAEFDVLAHASPGVRAVRSWVAEVGVRKAVRAYATGDGVPDVD